MHQLLGLVTVYDWTGDKLKSGLYPHFQNAVDTVRLLTQNHEGWTIEKEEKEGIVVKSPTGCTVVASLMETTGIDLSGIKELWEK